MDRCSGWDFQTKIFANAFSGSPEPQFYSLGRYFVERGFQFCSTLKKKHTSALKNWLSTKEELGEQIVFC